MPCIFPLLALLLALALPPPAAAQTAATGAEPTKQCMTARKKEDKEQLGHRLHRPRQEGARKLLVEEHVRTLRLGDQRHGKAPGAP
jgi:hypothetical protein